MKIVFIDPFGLYGLAHYNYGLCNALAKLGYSVTLLTSTNYELADWEHDFVVEPLVKMWRPLDASNLATGRGPLTKVRKGLDYLRCIAKLVLRARQLKPEIIHLTELFFALDILLVLGLRTSGAKLVHTCHNVRAFPAKREGSRITGKGIIGDRLQGWLYKSFDAIIFHAQENLDEYLRVFGGDPNRLHIVNMGNYAFHLPQGELSRQEARQKLGLPQNIPVVLFFGILRRYKGLEHLIEAFPQVKEKLPEARLLIAGAPYFDTDAEGYQRRAEQLGLGDTVWDLRYIPNEEVALYFTACDLVALPYIEIYQSAVLQLAYAFGKPVVASAIGGLVEDVEQGQSGLLVPPANPAALAEAIIAILESDALIQRMGQRAHQLAATKHSWSTIGEQTIALYTDLHSPR